MSEYTENILKLNPKNEFSVAGIDIIQCPVKKEEFKTKRWYRYIDKMNKILSDKMKICSSDDTKYTLYNVVVQISLTKICYDMRKYSDKISKLLDNYGNHPYDLYLSISPNMCFDKLCENEIFKSLAEKVCIQYLMKESYDNLYLWMAEQEFVQTLEDFLICKYVRMHNEEKFLASYQLDPSDTDLCLIQKYFFDKVYNNIILLISYHDMSLVTKSVNNYKKNIKEDYNEKIDKIKELEKQIQDEKQRGKDFLPTLMRLKKEAEEGTQAQQELFNNAITEKDREIRQLEKQINSLQDKLANINAQSDVKDEEITNLIQPVECDTTLRYTFVLHSYPEFENMLKEAFPNCNIVNSSDLFNYNNTDLTVFITRHLKHNMYYKIKSVCKANNVPFIHFSSTNIDMLKSEIARLYG